MRKVSVQFVFLSGEQLKSLHGTTPVGEEKESCTGTRSRKDILHLTRLSGVGLTPTE